MIFEKNANLLVELEENRLDAIIHSANCFHTFGAGIALQIARRFPEAAEADRRDSVRGDRSKLGTFTYAQVLSDPPRIVYNLYSQYTFGHGRQTLYDPMVEGLEKIKIHAMSKGLTKLGMPKWMGCRLGGGSWRVVWAIIQDTFEKEDSLDLFVCDYDPPKHI